MAVMQAQATVQPRATRRSQLALTQSIGSALEGVLANKLRSALTLLGILIGVGAVIVMLALGSGARAQVQQRLAGLGTNLLVIQSGSAREGPVQGGAGTQQTLTEADAQAIQQQVAGLAGVSPVLGGNDQVVANGNNWSTRWQGVYTSYLTMQNYQVASGTAFTDADESSRATVALIGQTVATNLFGTQNPVGQTIRLRNVTFTVQGLLASKGSNGFQDQDDIILVPFSTAQVRLDNVAYVQSIDAQVASASQMTSVESEIEQLLRQRHRLSAQANDDFNIRNNAQIQQTVSATSSTLTTLLAGVAGVSLVVGGIGIMNIMLVSVIERTREIGIRMAIGARRAVILAQFLMEALTLSLLGGLLGVVGGVAVAAVMARLAGWSTQVTLFSILLAFGFSAAVGIIFGIYPARSASRLDPIVALRTD